MNWKLVAFAVAVCIGFNMYDGFNKEQLKGKRVVITGASTGIGEQMAYHYAKMGAKIMITARREKRLQEVIQKCREVGDPKGEYFYTIADMSDTVNATKSVIQEANKRLGGIDFLVLNHIFVVPLGKWIGSSQNLTLLQKTLDVNFRAYVHLASHALPDLTKSKGSIVVVSSIAGKIGQRYLAPYSASKFALAGFFSALRQELVFDNADISVTLCTIGLIDTESAVVNLRNIGANFLLGFHGMSSAVDCAYAIIRGGAMRLDEVFFPYLEARSVSLLRDIFPNLINYVNNIFWADVQ